MQPFAERAGNCWIARPALVGLLTLRILLATLLLCGAAYALEPAQLLRNTSPSMVSVRALGDDERLIRTGGGIVIDRGKVVTNCHVLAKAKSLQVQHQDIIYRSTLEHADVERDLCQLDVPKLPAPAMTIGGVQTVRLGQPVHALTMPQTGKPFLVDSRVLALREFKSVPIVEISTDLPQRTGAAAIVDDNGRLIGITALMVKDTPDTTIAILADALKEIPRRAQQALERQRTAAPAKTPSGVTTSYAAEWASRIALLEKSQGELTLSKALAILLDVTNEGNMSSLREYENAVIRKDWHNGYAMGVDQKGNLIWGGGYRLRNAADALQTAIEQCSPDSRNACAGILVDGDFRESDFLDMAKRLGARDVAGSRQSFLDSLTKRPAETRVGLATSAGGGTEDSHYSYGYSSIRD